MSRRIVHLVYVVAVASCAAITAPQPTRSQAIIELSPPALKPLPPSMQDAPVRAPSAGVVVVVPGVQYGADGIGLVEGRENSAWQLCQSDWPTEGRCTPYNYQPYGPYGYRPLGTYYRPQPVAPAYIYVPSAKSVPVGN